MTADLRVQAAREFLAGARNRRVTELPPSILVRECEQSRRALGQLLDVLDEAITTATDDSTGVWLDGSATVADQDVPTILAALRDAVDYRTVLLAMCAECDSVDLAGADATACETHRADQEHLRKYAALIRVLSGGMP
jgi:hypothetical protein